MIRVERQLPPKFFLQQSVKNEVEYLLKFSREEAEIRRNSRGFKSRSKDYKIQKFRKELLYRLKEKLATDFNFKCAYCENRTEGELEHFRPISSARGLKGDFSFEHYWWLQYEWNNLYHACTTCNRNKASWFPVKGKRVELITPYENLSKEKALLIDPCNDYPEDHFAYEESGEIVALTENAKITIDILKLNRPQLIRLRRQVINEQLKHLKNIKNPKSEIRKLENNNENLDFLGARRFVTKKWLNKTQKKISKRRLSFSQVEVMNSYITEIEIKNFKKIRNLKFQISDKAAEKGEAPWLVFLGENGVGKSSILQAIAMTLSDPKYFSKFINKRSILNNKSESGNVLLKTDDEPGILKISLSKKPEAIISTYKKVPNYVIGFGATRIYKQKNLKSEEQRKFIRIGNLLDHTIAIINPEDWLLNLPPKIFSNAGAIIIKALAFGKGWKIHKKRGKIYITKGSLTQSLDSLSDGYKSAISLIVNIMAALRKSTSGFDDISGIVLIDEIELHLHPKWKLKFIKSFRAAFPKIQVFATTHDPLCLKGLYDREIVLIKETKRGGINCISELPSIEGLKAEQILTSEYFGLSSTIDPEDEEEFNRYYFLLGKVNLKEDERQELEGLQIKVLSKRQIGDSLRDELTMFAADEVIAREYLTGKILQRDRLKQATVDVLSNLLSKRKSK